MASSSRAGILRYGDGVPMLEPRHQWLLGKILLDDFFNREPVGGALPAERANDDENAPFSKLLHQTIFVDHSQSYGVTLDPRCILRMII